MREVMKKKRKSELKSVARRQPTGTCLLFKCLFLFIKTTTL